MRLTPPTKVVFWISTVVAVLALISNFSSKLPVVGGNEFLFMVVAFILLWLGVALKGF